jgi:hypothetical protein
MLQKLGVHCYRNWEYSAIVLYTAIVVYWECIAIELEVHCYSNVLTVQCYRNWEYIVIETGGTVL